MLTPNAISKIMNGSDPQDFQPLVQIIEIVKGDKHYKICISDGECFHHSVYISTMFKEALENGLIAVNHIIKLIDYCVTVNFADCSLLIFHFEQRFNPNNQFGKPVAFENRCLLLDQSPNPEIQYTPICKLLEVNDWIIKAKIIRKGQLTQWNNSKGKGDFFDIHIQDKSLSIARGIFFYQNAIKYFPLLSISKVYRFSCAKAKEPKGYRNSADASVEIEFSYKSVIQEDMDDTDFLESGDHNEGLQSTPLLNGSSSLNNQSPRSNISAKNINYNEASNPMENPRNILENISQSLPNQIEGLTIAANIINNKPVGVILTTVAEIQYMESILLDGSVRKFHILGILGKPRTLNVDDWIYPGCLNYRCKSKVDIIDPAGIFYCGRCNKQFSHCKYLYRLIIPLYDSTQTLEVKIFNSLASTLIGKSADEMQYLQTVDKAKSDLILFKLFGRKIVASVLAQQGRNRTEYTLVAVKNGNTALQTLLFDIKQIVSSIP